jgi:hypothetical protein
MVTDVACPDRLRSNAEERPVLRDFPVPASSPNANRLTFGVAPKDLGVLPGRLPRAYARPDRQGGIAWGERSPA